MAAFAIEESQHSAGLYRRSSAISLLGTFNKPQAIKGLIDGLAVDFQALAKGKNVVVDNNAELRDSIREHLKRITGQDYGLDRDAWLKWYRERYGSNGKTVAR